jgi:ribosome biogenesis protein MAK21
MAMGKRKGKFPAGKQETEGVSGSDALSSFNEHALSALTSKIEKGLGKRKPEHTQDSMQSRKKSKFGKSVTTAEAKSKTNELEISRGTKRNAQGKTKKPNAMVTKTKSDPEQKGVGKLPDERAMLLQEILALGGTEDDLDLVADVASDEEDEPINSAKAPDKAFQKDLANFVAELGLEKEAIEDEADADSENEDVAEDVSDFSEVASDEEDTPRTIVEINPLSSIEKANSLNGINRLVSTIPG